MRRKKLDYINIDIALNRAEEIGFFNLVGEFEDAIVETAFLKHKNKNRTSIALSMNRTTLVERMKKRQIGIKV